MGDIRALGYLSEYLEAWGPPDIAFGGQQYCRWGPVIATVGATDPQRGLRYWCAAACSRMLWVPVSIQMALWTMRSMMGVSRPFTMKL